MYCDTASTCDKANNRVGRRWLAALRENGEQFIDTGNDYTGGR
jgi:hypothetical protein